MRKSLIGIVAALGVCLWIEADAQERQEKVDLAVAHRIRDEAFGRNSRVMDIAFQLTDVHGPRLTGSPAARRAGEWAVNQMKEWGLANARLDPWGPFGRGWSCTRFVAMMKAPEFQPLIGFAQPWTPGTNGDVTGEAVLAVIGGPADLDKWKGKLKGKIVLTSAPHPIGDGHRASLLPPDRCGVAGRGRGAGAHIRQPGRVCRWGSCAAGLAMPAGGRGGRGRRSRFRSELNKFLKDEGVLVVLSAGGPGGGTVMGQGVYPRDPMQEAPPPSVVVTPEHYNRIARLLEKNVPVTLEFDIHNEFTEPGDPFNVDRRNSGHRTRTPAW